MEHGRRRSELREERLSQLEDLSIADRCSKKLMRDGEKDSDGGPEEIWTLDLPVISRALQPG